jgi:hypothetical protein
MTDPIAIRDRLQGFYTEQDGGPFYMCTPRHTRLAEGFYKSLNALKAAQWLAGMPMPSGWNVTRMNDLFAEVDCGQETLATIWIREALAFFPDCLSRLPVPSDHTD